MSSSLNEDQEALLRAKEAIDAEKESLRIDSRTLSNLRAEHARLKDDFRSVRVRCTSGTYTHLVTNSLWSVIQIVNLLSKQANSMLRT